MAAASLFAQLPEKLGLREMGLIKGAVAHGKKKNTRSLVRK
jgi:hypothetical protein